MYSLKDKVVIITGGAGGIGAAIVQEFLKEGIKSITICDINEEAGVSFEKELVAKYGSAKVIFMKCDVTNDAEFSAAFTKTIDENGYVDIVVNNAGIANDSLEKYKMEIDINFSAVTNGTLKAFELMRKDKEGRGGTVINIASAAALILGCPSFFVYSATKAGVMHLTCCMGKEPYFSKTNVRTVCMCFYFTKSNLHDNLVSFDEDIAKSAKEFQKIVIEQSAEQAAQGVVEAYKRGSSGSVWAVYRGNPALDITSQIHKAYDLMTHDVFLQK